MSMPTEYAQAEVAYRRARLTESFQAAAGRRHHAPAGHGERRFHLHRRTARGSER